MKDHDGQALPYVYFEDEHGRRTAANLFTRDEARRISANIAKKRYPLRPAIQNAIAWCERELAGIEARLPD